MTNRRRVALGVSAAIAALGVGLGIHHLATANDEKHERAAKPVTVVHAAARSFQPSLTFVGTLEPWLAANVGPQLVSAYIDSVEVRPGAIVKRGDLLATLDCREANAGKSAVAAEARAVDARRKALSAESDRFQDLLAKKFVSPNEAQQKAAASAAESAKLEAQQAKLARSSLDVADCVLRAPFDGEIATRTMDPGGFVRPGTAIVSMVDRATVRFTADIPEAEFEHVAPGTPVRITVLATRTELFGRISRRAPSADPSTRTVHFEIDIADAERRIPVGTTGEAHIDVGAAEPATAVPLVAATLRGAKASVFVVDGDVAHAHTFASKGEADGWLFLDPALAPGSSIVTEGRALIADGDRVASTVDDAQPPRPDAAARPERHADGGAEEKR